MEHVFFHPHTRRTASDIFLIIFLFWVDHRRICTSFGVSECPTWRIISHSYIVFSTTLNRSANFLSSPREERWSEVRVMIPVHLTGHPTDIACLWVLDRLKRERKRMPRHGQVILSLFLRTPTGNRTLHTEGKEKVNEV